ncbi:MAG: caspase family protein [Nitrospirae bacterium]|nr:MAG: caspase family protein [Nitrospirota bacterium]
MKRYRLLLVACLLLGTTACSVAGAVRENFHRAGEPPARKLPLKVGLALDDKLKAQHLIVPGRPGGEIDVDLYPGVFNALRTELANAFEEVTVFEGRAQPKNEDLLAFVTSTYEPEGTTFALAGLRCTIELVLKDARTGVLVSKHKAETRFPPRLASGGTVGAGALIVVLTVGLGWPLAAHMENADALESFVPQIEQRTSDLVRDIAADIQSNQQLLAYLRQRPGGPMEAFVPGGMEDVPLSSDVDTPPTVTAPVKKNVYALVFGIEKYRGQLPKADFAAHDAQIMAKYLTKVLGYPEENVVLRVNDHATKSDIQKYVETWLPNHVAKGDSVFIYYSGHGAPNAKTGDAYLVPYDGDPAFIGDTGYPLKRLYENLAKLPTNDAIVVLDSCFSGAGGRSVIAQGMRPMVLSVENPVLASGRTAVLAASSGEQVSSTYRQQGHGLLTYFFLKGLAGEADQDHDGVVQLKELFDYLKPQVTSTARRDFNNEQTPQLVGDPQILGKVLRRVEPPKP